MFHKTKQLKKPPTASIAHVSVDETQTSFLDLSGSPHGFCCTPSKPFQPTKALQQMTFEPPQTRQLTMETVTKVEAMHIAIANWIHCKGLLFSTADDPLFKDLMKRARLTGPNYTPPSRNDVAG